MNDTRPNPLQGENQDVGAARGAGRRLRVAWVLGALCLVALGLDIAAARGLLGVHVPLSALGLVMVAAVFMASSSPRRAGHAPLADTQPLVVPSAAE